MRQLCLQLPKVGISPQILELSVPAAQSSSTLYSLSSQSLPSVTACGYRSLLEGEGVSFLYLRSP